jgi:hypothetical protein
MTQLDVVLTTACIVLAILWIRAELVSQRQATAMREATTNAQAASKALDQAQSALEQAAVAIEASTAERVAAEERAEAAERKLSSREEQRARLAMLTEEEVTAQLSGRCLHCGGIHERACPRVRSLRFRPDGITPLAVEFWEHWDASEVIWPEDYVAAQADALAQERTGTPRDLKVIVG